MDAYVDVIGVCGPETDEESVHEDYVQKESDSEERDQPSESLQPASSDLVVVPFSHSKEKLSYEQLYAGFEFMWKEQHSPRPSDVYVKIQGKGMLFVFASPEECKKFKTCCYNNRDQLEEKQIRIVGGQKMQDFDKIGQNYKRWHK